MHSNQHFHLELITRAIERMAKNSALYKAWTITILSIISAIAIDKGKYELFFLGLFVVFGFYIADAYYLWLEKSYVSLYKIVASKEDESKINYNMNIKDYKTISNLFKALFSMSQIFYLITISLLGCLIFVYFNKEVVQVSFSLILKLEEINV